MESSLSTLPVHGEHDRHHAHHPQAVQFQVNRHEVQMTGHEHTGLQIKQAAKNQGVKIELDFLLYLLRPHQPNRLIHDAEEVHIFNESHFRAIADDDNS